MSVCLGFRLPEPWVAWCLKPGLWRVLWLWGPVRVNLRCRADTEAGGWWEVGRGLQTGFLLRGSPWHFLNRDR